ncbi:MAG: type VI secretion system protein TssA [Betaproteobacteria bacterium]|nr:type VI secretion system protein TssA [Betaproteobacteria bacterium]
MTDSIFSPILFEAAASVGENLEYADTFSEFMTLSTPREERQVGEHIVPAQPPNWTEVLKTGCALLERSRDLRILAKVCQAALHKHGLQGLAQGLGLVARWIENDWDHLYPQIEEDGIVDPLYRSNAVSEISELVHALRQTTLLETPVGTVTLFAAEQALEGKQDEGSPVASPAQLSRILVAEKDRNQGRLAAISSIVSSLASIDSAFKERFKSEYWPDIDLLTKVVTRLNRFIVAQLQEQEAESSDLAPQADGDVPSPPRASGPLPSALNTRADACKALALAREYFERHEPSHPAPLLIRRVERIGGSDFLAIIQELMPSATDQVRQLAGEG